MIWPEKTLISRVIFETSVALVLVPSLIYCSITNLFSRAAWQRNNLFVQRKLQVWAREHVALYSRDFEQMSGD